MPPDVLEGVGYDSSQPVTALLLTSRVNLRGAPAASNSTSSAVVTFSLLQGGQALRIAGAPTAINVSLPYTVGNSSAAGDGDGLPCIGTPADAEAAAACDATIECRFWNVTDGNWSTAGCTTTLGADGTIGFSCTHLTKFIAFEFPISAEDLTELALAAVRVNHLTRRAFECALHPSSSWDSVPEIWGCTFVLLGLFLLLMTNAICRDRRDLWNLLMIVDEAERQRG